jgi:hypothetical protein
VEGIATSVLVGSYVVGLAINLEGRVLDAIGVTSRDTTGDLLVIELDPVRVYPPEVRVKLVLGVVGSVVPTENDITLDSVLVCDEQVGDGCAVRNEVGANSLR